MPSTNDTKNMLLDFQFILTIMQLIAYEIARKHLHDQTISLDYYKYRDVGLDCLFVKCLSLKSFFSYFYHLLLKYKQNSKQIINHLPNIFNNKY